MFDEDDDLFDAPVRTKKPSNKIVHQPAGASWSLSRLPEVETAYQTTFKKKLPLVNRGQGGIHNKWGYDHRDSADVSINPSTPEGQQFIEQLKKQGVPFLAFTGAIPGVATGPHVHIGFPSRKTQKKFNIGAQRRKQSVASDDLFDADDDLFDQVQGQTPPPETPRLSTRTATRPATSPSAQSVPASRLSQMVTGSAQGQRPRTGTESLLESIGGREKRGEDIQNILEAVTSGVAGTGRQLANAQDLGMRVTPAGIAGRALTKRVTGFDPQAIPSKIRDASQYLESGVAENEAARPAPTTITGNIRRGLGKGVGASVVELPKLLLGGMALKAANLPVQGALARADEGYTGIAKGAAGGLVYHYGGALTGKAFSGVSPYLAKIGNSLVWIAGPVAEQQIAAKVTGSEAPNLAQSIGENIPFGIMAGMGAKGKQKRPEPVQVKEGNTVRPATEADLPKIVNRELEVVPPAVEQAERRQIQREFDRIKEKENVEIPDRPLEDVGTRTVSTQETVPPTTEAVGGRPPELKRFQHIQFGEVEVVPDQTGAREGRIKVAEVADPTKQHFVKKSDMQGRGNARMIPVKEVATPQAGEIAQGTGEGTPKGTPVPSIPERPETINAQLEARGYALIPNGTPRPSKPQGYRAEKTPDGVVYYDPKRIDAETIRSTPTTELLGHVEPKSERTTEAVVARTPDGTELHSSAVSPENLAKQVEVTKTNFPEAKVEAGGPEVAEKVIQERLEPSTTSAKKASMAEDRAELDLPELPQAERKSWQDTLDRAKVRGTKNASILADEVLARPRSLNEVETAQLVLRAQEIKNDHARVMKEIGNEKNPESIQAKRAEVEALEREFDRLTQATKASGTEKGRALASQKLTINQDYDLVSLVQRAKAAKGRDLTPEERTRYEGMAKEIESLTEKLGKAEEQLASRQLQREIDRVIRRGRRAETKKELDAEFETLKAQFAQIKTTQGAGAFFKSERGALEPEAIKVIGQMARNRIRAGTVKADALVDEIHSFASQHLEGITKRDIRDAISGYGLERKGKPRAEDVKELARIKTELRKLSVQEDIEAGKRLTPAEKTRQTNLLKQEADLTRRLAEKDFDRPERRTLVYNRETQALVNRVNKLKGEYERELYKAQRGKLGVAWDVGVNVANVPKSLKSMGDVSAVLRQGGYFSLTHPVLSTKAGLDMLRSFSDTGFRNVEREIMSHRDFDLARRSGVEFTGMEKDNPNLSKREEAFLGADIIDRASEIPVAGKVVKPVKAVKDFSERTFVSFLDSQRMQVFSRFADHVRSLKMSPKEETKALKAMAQFVNIGTGRGSLGRRGNQIAPALNTLMFSPRLLASRVQLMNKMVNPVAIARMPKGARSQIIKDNVKFAGTIATALGLAKAAGAGVSLDPDDADFLKIRIGDTRYDILTGLQQPMRFIYRMARAIQADATGDETYAGEKKGALVERFARSKASPVAGGIADYITGEDFKGRKFKLSRQLVDLVTPLYLTDFREAMEEDGIVGALVKTSPALVGVGAQTYKDAPEKPHTHAEKLARKFVRARMPDNAREEEQIDVDQAKADLRAKSRRGEDVTKELEALGATITDRQAKNIINARNKTRLQEDVNRLSAKDAIIVWGVMNPGQQQETRSLLEHKATLIDNLPEAQQADVRRRYADAGIEARTKKKASTGFKKAFNRGFQNQFANP